MNDIDSKIIKYSIDLTILNNIKQINIENEILQVITIDKNIFEYSLINGTPLITHTNNNQEINVNSKQIKKRQYKSRQEQERLKNVNNQFNEKINNYLNKKIL